MPAPTNTYNDGGIKFVRQTISALDSSGATTSYIVKKGSLKRGVKRVVSENENGVEFKQGFMKQIPSGSLTLQFIEEDDKPPKLMQAITVIDTTGASIDVIIAGVDDEFGAGEEAMVTAEIYEAQA